MTHDLADRRLREAFALVDDEGPVDGDCPPPATIWRAVRGTLPATQTRRLIDHSAHCRSCAEAWRVAHEFNVAASSDLGGRAAPWRPRTVWLVAVAASLLALLLPVWWLSRPPGQAGPEYRDGPTESAGIASLIPEDEPLPRDRFVLRWSEGTAGSRYILRVSTEDLVLLHEQKALDRTEHEVPADAFAGVPAGARILWRVEAVQPDGERLASPTFFARVE